MLLWDKNSVNTLLLKKKKKGGLSFFITILVYTLRTLLIFPGRNILDNH